MSTNPTFVQALADLSRRPVEVSPVADATTLGAAFLAGLAVGALGRRSTRRPRCGGRVGRRARRRPLRRPGAWADAVERAAVGFRSCRHSTSSARRDGSSRPAGGDSTRRRRIPERLRARLLDCRRSHPASTERTATRGETNSGATHGAADVATGIGADRRVLPRRRRPRRRRRRTGRPATTSSCSRSPSPFELTARDLYQAALDGGLADSDLADVFTTLRDNHEEYANRLSGILGVDAPQHRDDALFDELVGGFDGRGRRRRSPPLASTSNRRPSPRTATCSDGCVGSTASPRSPRSSSSRPATATVLADVAGNGDDLDAMLTADAEALAAPEPSGWRNG